MALTAFRWGYLRPPRFAGPHSRPTGRTFSTPIPTRGGTTHHVRDYCHSTLWLLRPWDAGDHAPVGSWRALVRPEPPAAGPFARQDSDRIQARCERPRR